MRIVALCELWESVWHVYWMIMLFLWCYLFIKAQCLSEMNGLDAASFIIKFCLWTKVIVKDHSNVKVFALNLCNKYVIPLIFLFWIFDPKD